MTLPDERYRAVVQTAKFLESLSYSSETKRVPLAVRQEARRLLRHYPNDWDMKAASQLAPHVFQERMEEVTRLFKQYEQSKAEQNEN
jgi:hypothetical protein